MVGSTRHSAAALRFRSAGADYRSDAPRHVTMARRIAGKCRSRAALLAAVLAAAVHVAPLCGALRTLSAALLAAALAAAVPLALVWRATTHSQVAAVRMSARMSLLRGSPHCMLSFF